MRGREQTSWVGGVVLRYDALELVGRVLESSRFLCWGCCRVKGVKWGAVVVEVGAETVGEVGFNAGGGLRSHDSLNEKGRAVDWWRQRDVIGSVGHGRDWSRVHWSAFSRAERTH